MPNIPNRLKELRRQNCLSQADVAKRLNSTSALVSAYENAERYPSLEKLMLLADIYNWSTDYKLGRTYDNEDKIFFDVTKLSERQRMIIRSLIEDMEDNRK